MNTVEEIKYLGVTLTQYVSINYTKELGKNPVPSSMKYKIYSATARELPHTLLQTHRSPPPQTTATQMNGHWPMHCVHKR